MLTHAPTGIGKTMHHMGMGTRISAGQEFLRWKGCRPCKVLYIDGEMSRRLLQQRLRDETKRLGFMPEGFHALSHEDVGEHWAPLNTPQGQAIVEARIEAMGGVDLIEFDNIMSLIGGDMKDEEGWRLILPWIHSLTRRQIGQIWIHHSNEETNRTEPRRALGRWTPRPSSKRSSGLILT